MPLLTHLVTVSHKNFFSESEEGVEKTLDLSNSNIELALIELAFEFKNISEKFNNREFRYFDSSDNSYKIITLDTGSYPMYDIIDKLKIDGIQFTINTNSSKVEFTIENGMKIDFSHGEIYKIFGADPIEYSQSFIPENKANVSLGFNYFHVYLSYEMPNGTLMGQKIHTFTQNGPSGTTYNHQPCQKTHLGLPKKVLKSLRVNVYDQDNEIIEDWPVLAFFRVYAGC